MNTATDRIDSIARFMRAIDDDLPHPASIQADNYSASIRFDSLDDLRQWAAYLEAEIAARPGLAEINQDNIVYHEASTGLLDHDPVRLLFMEYILTEVVA